jgi:hypothetical protein
MDIVSQSFSQNLPSDGNPKARPVALALNSGPLNNNHSIWDLSADSDPNMLIDREDSPIRRLGLQFGSYDFLTGQNDSVGASQSDHSLARLDGFLGVFQLINSSFLRVNRGV